MDILRMNIGSRRNGFKAGRPDRGNWLIRLDAMSVAEAS